MGFAAYLAALMGQSRVTKQAVLANGAGVTVTAVSRWLLDQSTPNPEACKRIAAYFGVSEEEVLRAAGHLSPVVAVVEEDPEERELVRLYRRLDGPGRACLRAFARHAREVAAFTVAAGTEGGLADAEPLRTDAPKLHTETRAEARRRGVARSDRR